LSFCLNGAILVIQWGGRLVRRLVENR